MKAGRFSLRRSGWSKAFVLWVWYPLATLCFAAGAILSVLYFDGPFDWRYRTLSSLSTQDTNPNGYIYCCVGLMLGFAMGLPLCGYFRVRLQPIAPKTAAFSSRALKIGFGGAVAVGFERLVIQSAPFEIYKAHECVSIVTFFGILLGIAGFWLCFNRWLLQERQWPTWALATLFLLSAGPIIGTGLSQAYLYFFPNNLGWVGPQWGEMAVPIYLSFAFWEWLTCVGIFIYLFLTILCLPEEAPATPPERPADGLP